MVKVIVDGDGVVVFGSALYDSLKKGEDLVFWASLNVLGMGE